MPNPLRFRYDPSLEDGAQRYLAARRGQDAMRPAPRAMKPAAKVLSPLLRDIGLTLAELEARWLEIVGDKLAQLTQPEKLSGHEENRTLSLRAHAAVAPLVQHQAGLILERLRLAGADVMKLKILHGAPLKRPANVASLRRSLDPSEARLLEIGLEPIQDAALRAALHRLGLAVSLAQEDSAGRAT